MGNFLRRLSRHFGSNLIAYVALFVALSGSAYAGKALLTGADIQDGSLTSVDLANTTVTGGKIADNTLTGAKIDESTLAGVDADKLDGIDSTGFMKGRVFTEFAALAPGGQQTFQLPLWGGSGNVECFTDREDVTRAAFFISTAADTMEFWSTGSNIFDNSSTNAADSIAVENVDPNRIGSVEARAVKGGKTVVFKAMAQVTHTGCRISYTVEETTNG